MGVKLDIIIEESIRRVDLPAPSTKVVSNTTTGPVVVNNTQQTAKTVEVLKGLQGQPGLQNVVVTDGPEPAEPFEGMIWVKVT